MAYTPDLHFDIPSSAASHPRTLSNSYIGSQEPVATTWPSGSYVSGGALTASPISYDAGSGIESSDHTIEAMPGFPSIHNSFNGHPHRDADNLEGTAPPVDIQPPYPVNQYWEQAIPDHKAYQVKPPGVNVFGSPDPARPRYRLERSIQAGKSLKGRSTDQTEPDYISQVSCVDSNPASHIPSETGQKIGFDKESIGNGLSARVDVHKKSRISRFSRYFQRTSNNPRNMDSAARVKQGGDLINSPRGARSRNVPPELTYMICTTCAANAWCTSKNQCVSLAKRPLWPDTRLKLARLICLWFPCLTRAWVS